MRRARLGLDRRRATRLLVVAAGLLAGGCAAALDLATRSPPRLFQLTPKSTFPVDLPTVESRLDIEVPSATAGLNTARIALRPTPTSLDYYAGASWTEVVPVMVQNLIVESLDNSGRIDVIGREVVGVRANYALLSNVREFQAEYFQAGAPRVRVRVQVRLVELPRRTSIVSGSFEDVVPAAGTSLDEIVAAFDQAFGSVAKDLVAWALNELAAIEAEPG